tara:strand:+ start:1057 stop:1476 length:420 start_codon:yes stop_codon:yes gene_type:complete
MSYKIVAKYLKDINFKIPNSKSFFFLTKNISNYKINIDIKSNQIKENVIEIDTTLSLRPIKEDSNKIDTRIIYSTIIEVTQKNIEKENLEKIILIDVPSKIYSDLRKVFIFIFEQSGFKEIKISENVDFQKLYSLKKIQ